MKTFREMFLTEDLAEYPDTSGVPAEQAIDDVDNGAMYVEDPKNLDMLNSYVSQIGIRPSINPYYIVNKLWMKLNMIGLNFDLKAATFYNDHGEISLPLTQYGGRYGFLDTDGVVKSDDGISNRIPGGLTLKIFYTKTNGLVHLDAKLEKSMANFNGPLGESENKRSKVLEPQHLKRVWGSGDHMYGAIHDPLAPSGLHHTVDKTGKGEHPVARLNSEGQDKDGNPLYSVNHWVKRTEPFPEPIKGFNK